MAASVLHGGGYEESVLRGDLAEGACGDKRQAENCPQASDHRAVSVVGYTENDQGLGATPLP